MSLGVLNQSIVELHKNMQPRDWDPDEKLERAARKEKVRQRVEANKARALAGEVTEAVPDTSIEPLNIYSTETHGFQYLSNPITPGFEWEGREYRSMEHAYQSNKAGKFDEPAYRAFLNAPNSKRPSQGTMGVDKNTNKALMKNMYREMLNQNPEQVDLLLKTGNRPLSHTQDKTVWKEWFPQMLEELREEFRNITPEVKVETVKRYTVEDVRANPDKIYIYGDNLERIGKKNQSIIRDEPNALGIATKKAPSMGENAFFTDDEFEANKKIIDEDIAAIKADGRPIVLPEDGIGTGLASLKNRAPKTFAYLQEQLDALKGGTSKSKIKIFYPFKPEEPGRTHANWFIEFMEETQPDKEIIMVDNPRDADFIMARHFKDTPSSKLMGNPFGHQSSGGNQIVTTKNLDETEKLYKAWLRGEEIPNITDEQKKQLDVIRKGLDKKVPTFQPGSLGAAKVDVPDEIIETQTNVPKGTLKRMFSSVPGYAVVPLEQLVEDVLSVTKWKGAVKPWIKYELQVFGASIVGGLLYAIAGAGGAMAAGTMGPSVMNLSAGREVVPTKKIREQIPERALIQAIEMGGAAMSTIVKASPSYWIDEYLLKKYEDELPTEDTKFMEGGWQTWFPQLGVPYAKVMDRYTENAEKPSYDYLKGLSK